MSSLTSWSWSASPVRMRDRMFSVFGFSYDGADYVVGFEALDRIDGDFHGFEDALDHGYLGV